MSPLRRREVHRFGRDPIRETSKPAKVSPRSRACARMGVSMSVRVPCLDGLRGISVCLVLLAHLSGTRELTSGAWLPELYGLGNLGVRVFFVISGFLITLLLLHERATTGRISLL